MFFKFLIRIIHEKINACIYLSFTIIADTSRGIHSICITDICFAEHGPL